MRILVDGEELKSGNLNAGFEDDKFDVIYSVCVIEHIPNYEEVLREAFRTLKPGGTLCLLEADRDCTFTSSRRFTEQWRHILPRFLTLCTSSLWRKR